MALLLVLGASGCIRYTPYEVTRTVGGEVRRGVFVSPPQYEDFVRGELAAAREDWAGAAEAFTRARSEGEEDVLLLSRLADVLDRQGDRVRAEEMLSRGESLDPHAEIVWQTRGVIAERHGEVDAAIAAYEHAHDAEPSSEEPVLSLARMLAAHDHADRSATLLGDFVRHAASPLGAARASLALAMARGDLVGLVDAASELVRIAPGHANEIESAVRVLRDRGDVLIAHRLLSQMPEETVDRELAIEVAIAAGDHDAAERWLAFPRDEHPRSLTIDARHWLALGDAARAAELAEVARSDAEASSEATLVLGQARLAMGAFAEAARLFASIPVGSSQHEPARAGLASALAAGGLAALGAEVLR